MDNSNIDDINNNTIDNEDLITNITRAATASYVLPYTASVPNTIEQLESESRVLFSLHSMFSNQLHRLQLEEVALKKQLGNQ